MTMTEVARLAGHTVEATRNKALWAWLVTHGPEEPYGWMERDRCDRGLDDSRDRWEQQRVAREACIRNYCFSVPTEDALALIGRYGPVVEIGAGTGYWAALLQDRGVDICAFDSHPPGPDREDNHWFKRTETFIEVGEADETIISQFGDRALMLAWPPYEDAMATRTLDLYRDAGGQTLIYVGEGAGGCCADDTFFRRFGAYWDEDGPDHDLSAEWYEVESLLLPQWDGINDWLTIFRRR